MIASPSQARRFKQYARMGLIPHQIDYSDITSNLALSANDHCFIYKS